MFLWYFKGYFLFVLGVLINLMKSVYFGQGTIQGFNLHPINLYEFLWDAFSLLVMVLGVFVMLRDILLMKKQIHKMSMLPLTLLGAISKNKAHCNETCSGCRKEKENEQDNREPTVTNKSNDGNDSGTIQPSDTNSETRIHHDVEGTVTVSHDCIEE